MLCFSLLCEADRVTWECYPIVVVFVVLLGGCFLILWLYLPHSIKEPHWVQVSSELLLVSVDVLPLGPWWPHPLPYGQFSASSSGSWMQSLC